MKRLRVAIICLVAVIGGVAPVAPASAASSEAVEATAPDRIRVCGIRLCDGRGTWTMRAASVYGSLGEPLPSMQMAQSAGANTIRITDFLPEGLAPDAAIHDEQAWQRVDVIMATAAQLGMHVVLDLSSYRNMLERAGLDPYAHDWTAFLVMTATRVNTVSGLAYRDDPTIALVSIAGEPAAPRGDPGIGVPTTDELTAFYRRTLGTWSALAPISVVSSGGLLHIDWDSGIDWTRICALPVNDVCAIHVYGHRSLRRGLPEFADVSLGLDKPWLMLESGVPQRIGDPARARWLTRVLTASWRLRAAGVGIWNVGPQMASPPAGTYDINPGTPMAWAALQRGFAGHPRHP